MNNLSYLREHSRLSMRRLSELTKISNPIFCYLENEQRPFREVHIARLTDFFDVTSDFLLGKSDKGIHVYASKGDSDFYLSKADYEKYYEYIKESVIEDKSSEKILLKIKSTQGDEMIFFGTGSIYREIDIDKVGMIGSDSKKDKIKSYVDSMDDNQLDKTKKFIEDYIL